MPNPETLAENLRIITGADFSAMGGLIVSESLSGIQRKLLTQTHERSGVKALKSEAATAMIDITDVNDDVAAEIQRIAEEEPGRIKRLERLQGLLEQKTGVKFEWDESHKILLTPDPMGKAGDPAKNFAELNRINALGRSGAYEHQYVDAPDIQIGVFDIKENILKRVNIGIDGNPGANRA